VGKEDARGEFSTQAYVEQGSLLAQTDTFVHKALVQALELKSHYGAYEKEFLNPLKEAITKLLQRVDNPKLQPKRLNELAQLVADHTNIYWYLDRLEQSLQQQINGLERLYPEHPDKKLPPLPARHLKTLQHHLKEVGALTRKYRLVMDTARTALAIVEVQESKRANKSQNYFNSTVAFIGVFLAADQILDTEFAKELLIYISLYSRLDEDKIPYWVLFFTRTTTAVGLAAILFGLGWLVKMRVHK
jgi:hypothetical protein